MERSTITEVIRQARKHRGWTQEEAAQNFGMSLPTYRRLERGQGAKNIEQLRRVAEIYDIPLRTLGLADDALPITGTTLARAAWALFYSGQRQVLDTLMYPLLGYLETQRYKPSRETTRAYQVATTFLRDKGDLTRAQQAADQAVLLATELNEVDELACAYFARSRVPIDAARIAQPVEQVSLFHRALKDAEAAVVLAPRCRPIVAGIVHMNLTDVRAKLHLTGNDLLAPIEQTMHIVGNNVGTDDGGMILHPAGVLHLRARARLEAESNLMEAEQDVLSALDAVPATYDRWAVEMIITQARILGALNDVDAALSLASTLAIRSSYAIPETRALPVKLVQIRSKRLVRDLTRCVDSLPNSRDKSSLLHELVKIEAAV